MKQILLGKSGISLSSIVMGLWQAGKEMWTGIEEKSILSAVHQALESGVYTFDTAESYGNGESERVLGKALLGKREKAIILTKVGASHLTPNKLQQACENSLRNLKTDFIDLYQIHWPSGSWGSERVPLEDSLECMNRLKKEGKIRSIGVSNFSLEQLQSALKYSQIDSLQPPYSVFWRYIEKNGLSDFCKENNITLLAYSPLAQGVLTGKFGATPKIEEGDHRIKNKLFDKDVYPDVLTALEELRAVADEKGVSLTQLALAWVIFHPNSAAIVGVRNDKQIKESALGGDISLTHTDVERIETASRPVYERFLSDSVPWHWSP